MRKSACSTGLVASSIIRRRCTSARAGDTFGHHMYASFSNNAHAFFSGDYAGVETIVIDLSAVPDTDSTIIQVEQKLSCFELFIRGKNLVRQPMRLVSTVTSRMLIQRGGFKDVSCSSTLLMAF